MKDQNQNILQNFVDLAIERHRLLVQRNIRAANKTFDKLYKSCARTMRSLPDEGESILKVLVQHEHPEVRAEAAYLLLPIDEKLAIRTLKVLASSAIPWVSSSSGTTMAEWKAGRLDVDWFMK